MKKFNLLFVIFSLFIFLSFQNDGNPPPGYRWNEDKSGYVDINECLENPDVCLPEYECVNYPGGYKCIAPPGYEIVVGKIFEYILYGPGEVLTTDIFKIIAQFGDYDNKSSYKIPNCKEGSPLDYCNREQPIVKMPKL